MTVPQRKYQSHIFLSTLDQMQAGEDRERYLQSLAPDQVKQAMEPQVLVNAETVFILRSASLASQSLTAISRNLTITVPLSIEDYVSLKESIDQATGKMRFSSEIRSRGYIGGIAKTQTSADDWVYATQLVPVVIKWSESTWFYLVEKL